MQIWYAVEKENTGVYLVDKDGETLWKHPYKHAHYGWIARHAPGVPGLHPHTAEDSRRADQDHYPIYLPDGSTWLNLTDWQRKNFVPVHWDEQPEVTFIIRKEDKRIVRLLESGEIEDVPEGALPETAEYGRNLGCVDVLGDSRENIVTVDPVNHKLLVLANPTPMRTRHLSLARRILRIPSRQKPAGVRLLHLPLTTTGHRVGRGRPLRHRDHNLANAPASAFAPTRTYSSYLHSSGSPVAPARFCLLNPPPPPESPKSTFTPNNPPSSHLRSSVSICGAFFSSPHSTLCPDKSSPYLVAVHRRFSLIESANERLPVPTKDTL
jgi:hypothetical protein